MGATWQAADRRLSDEVVGYWANFARSGDPNGGGLVKWPRYDTEGMVLHLDEPVTVSADTTRAEFVFLASQPAAPMP